MQISLTVIKPVISACNQSFDAMHPTDGGRFCDHCQKKVHDLRQLNNVSLFDFKQQHPDACVHINSMALQPVVKAKMLPEPQLIRLRRFAFLLFVIFGPLLFSCNEEEHVQVLNAMQEKVIPAPGQPEITTADTITPPEEIAQLKILHACMCAELDEEIIEQDTAISLPEEEINEPQWSDYWEEGIELEQIEVNGNAYSHNLHSDMITTGTIGALYYVVNVIPVELDSIDSIHPPAIADVSFAVYPNPVMNRANIKYSGTEEAPLTIQVYSTNGQLMSVVEEQLSPATGTYIKELDVSAWPSGMYPIIMVNGENTKHFNLVVTH